MPPMPGPASNSTRWTPARPPRPAAPRTTACIGSLAPVRSIAIAAAVIALGNVVSRLLGLVREQVMAALFGATAATDAFVAASSVPQIVYDLLVGGAISAALVPIFVDAANDEDRLWRLLNTVLTLVVLVLAAVGIVLGLFAPTVVALPAGGFGPETPAAPVPMVRGMLMAGGVLGGGGG